MHPHIGDPFFSTVRDMGNWYTKMRSGMERRIIKRCIEEGELITTKAPAVGRSMVKAIAASLPMLGFGLMWGALSHEVFHMCTS